MRKTKLFCDLMFTIHLDHTSEHNTMEWNANTHGPSTGNNEFEKCYKIETTQRGLDHLNAPPPK